MAESDSSNADLEIRREVRGTDYVDGNPRRRRVHDGFQRLLTQWAG